MKIQQQIRANFDKNSIVVYQAYGKIIAENAVKNNKFQSPFSFNRMTWIKPSFLWLMQRSNWAEKANQNYILAIRISREFWEELLNEGVLTNPDKLIYKNGQDWDKKFKNAKVHIQWDPERSLRGSKLEIRSIQVGVSRFLIEKYNEKGIIEISDLTPLVKKINNLRKQGKYKEAKKLLPPEKIYDLPISIQNKIGIK